MVAILYAKSLEINKIITADEADSYRKLGKIHTQHRFECIDENCDAQITCANLMKEISKRKKDPYFIYVGDHTEECEIGSKIKIEEREQQEKCNSQPLKYISDSHQYLNLDIPSSVKVKTTQNSNSLNESSINSASANNTSNSSGKRPSNRRISGWVKDFLAKKDVFLSFGDTEIHINELFVPISDGLDIETLEEEPRIYFGKAWINPNPSFGFQIKFCNKVKLLNLEKQPSFMIYDNKIRNEALNGRFSKRTLDELAENNKPITFYIFSLTSPHIDKSGKYINLYAKELTYLYYQ